MTRKSLRTLSLVLTAVMVLSVANPGITASATEVNSVIEQEVVSEEATTEVATEATTEVVLEASEETTTEVATEATTEAVTEDSTEETTTEAAKKETKNKLEAKVEVPDATQSKYNSLSSTTSLKGVIKDTVLLELVVAAYNEGMNYSEDDAKTVDTITVGALQQYNGALNFDGAEKASQVQSIEGLGVAMNATSIDISALTGVTSIPEGEFANCVFSSFAMPTSITYIGDEAFNKCTKLSRFYTGETENTFPVGLTYMGQKAFLDNYALTTVEFPAFTKGDVLESAVGLFNGCTSLSSVTISKEITIIPSAAFYSTGKAEGCDGLTVTFKAGSKLSKIQSNAFNGAKFAMDTFPLGGCDQLLAIGPGVFRNSTGLTTVKLPSTAGSNNVSIGEYAFAQTSITTINTGSEAGIYIPDYVTSIGQGAFFGNTVMTKVSLPYGISTIEDYMFDGCNSLATIEQRTDASGSCNVTLIGDCAFRNTSITNTEFLLDMNNLTQIGRQLVDEYCLGQTKETYIHSIAEGGEESKVDSSDLSHKQYDGDDPCGSEVFTGCKKLTSITIPESVKVIATRAFYFAEGNKTDSTVTVVWKNTTGTAGVIRQIYSEAFRNNRITSLSLPQNTSESLRVGACAFYNNAELTSIQYNETESTKGYLPNTMTAIGNAAFMGCAALTKAHIQSVNGGAPALSPQVFEGCTSMTEASLPAAVTEIPMHFYALCPLTSFNFGDMTKVTKIGILAFFRHQFTTIDLSACAALSELGAECFARGDSLKRDYSNDIKTTYSNEIEDLGNATLTTVILPASLPRLYFNTAVFYGQASFDTMYASGSAMSDVISVPAYVPQSSKGVFAVTGVKKVVWVADTASDTTNRWTTLPEQTFEGCMYLTKAEDAMPKYVEKIGMRAFAESGVVSADLSSFANLNEISSGKLDSGNYYGAFMDCESLTTVVLPDNNVKDGIIIGKKTFGASTNGTGCAALKTVILGSASSIGEYAFTKCTALETIDLAKVTKIEKYGFSSCSGLKTVNFRSLETLGENVFEGCTSLVLTETPLPDTLTIIGDSAFKTTTQLGKVVLGSGILQIDDEAFLDSGLTHIDFSKAGALVSIGDGAFQNTKLQDFVLKGTKVTAIGTNTFKLCSKLESASFGEEVSMIEKNALAGCAKFSSLTIYATTTVSEEIFYDTPNNAENKPQITGMDNGKASNNSIPITVSVMTPEETIISYGREMSFPYYVNSEGESKLSHICIYNGDNQFDDSVENLLGVRAKLSDGYYKCTNKGEEYRVSDTYYTKLTTAETQTVKYGLNNSGTKDVDVIKVTGLRETTATDNIKLDVIADIDFECKDETYSITASEFRATYNIRIVDPAPMAVVYTDSKFTDQWPVAPTIQLTGSPSAKQYYYQMVDRVSTGSTITDKNVVIETSDTAVVYPSGSTTKLTNPPATYTTKVTRDSDMRFYLTPAGLGTATISIYPADCTPELQQKYKVTYTVTVGSNVSNISLQVPKGYNSSDVNPGAEFCVFKEYKNYFGQVCSVDDMSNFDKYTNATITFDSDAPDYVSVDQRGNIKVLKADATSKSVTIKVTANNSEPKYNKSATLRLTVKYPTVKKDQEVVDPATGANVKVTKTSTKDLQGEVVYEGPSSSSATTIVIPDTVTINGLRYKVTTIKAGMFKNNKKIKTVSIGNNVKTIEDNAFYGCSALTTVTVGSEVTKIGKKAFYNCKKLKTVNLASKGKLTTIGDSAFQNCYKLTKVKIPNSVTTIGNKAFYNCKVLKTVTISSSAKLTSIGSQSFAKCVKLTAITLPKKFRTIGAKAFYNCKALKKITVKGTALSSVGTNALKGIHKKCVIKVPKKKLKQYKTLFAGKGQKKSVKIKK